MKKRLVVLFDGTWNTRDDRTNVARLADEIAKVGADGMPQELWYDAGPGTNWYDRIRGGAFGYGTSRNIREGYRWVAGQWDDNQELYVFGFSRGAYTARSMVGLIRKCGLLKSPTDDLVEQAYDLYRDKDVNPDSPKATAFRAAHSREIRVKFIGVWDTVGCLGVPLTGTVIPWSRDHYQWHDTELSKIVDYAYHAVAVDEHREDYQATVWTQYKPENKDVEQRWFIGAHANVGGGYKHDRLHNIPLRWLQDKALATGLGMKELRHVNPDDHRAKITDSFADFMFGVYKVFRRGERYHRPFGKGVKETVDESVWKRWQELAEYRPPSLSDEARKRGLPV
jgi:uncharacterized protein (DUF2235 family)